MLRGRRWGLCWEEGASGWRAASLNSLSLCVTEFIRVKSVKIDNDLCGGSCGWFPSAGTTTKLSCFVLFFIIPFVHPGPALRNPLCYLICCFEICAHQHEADHWCNNVSDLMALQCFPGLLHKAHPKLWGQRGGSSYFATSYISL